MGLRSLLLLPRPLLGRENRIVDPVSNARGNRHEFRSREFGRGEPGELPLDGGQRLGLDLGRDRMPERPPGVEDLRLHGLDRRAAQDLVHGPIGSVRGGSGRRASGALGLRHGLPREAGYRRARPHARRPRHAACIRQGCLMQLPVGGAGLQVRPDGLLVAKRPAAETTPCSCHGVLLSCGPGPEGPVRV